MSMRQVCSTRGVAMNKLVRTALRRLNFRRGFLGRLKRSCHA